MAHEVRVRDTVTGLCGWATPICPTVVTSADSSLTVTNVGTPQAPVFDISASYTVDINVQNFTYDAVAKDIILTETDGTVHTINVADLVDTETVTTMVQNANGTYTYTSEDATATTIDICTLESGLANFGTLQCT